MILVTETYMLSPSSNKFPRTINGRECSRHAASVLLPLSKNQRLEHN